MIDINTLQKYSLFGGVTCEQIEKIKPLLGTERFDAGECPQVEGQPNDKIYFILSGEVEVIKQGVVIARLREGETFGEMELLDIMPSIATIRAATPLEVVDLQPGPLRHLQARPQDILDGRDEPRPRPLAAPAPHGRARLRRGEGHLSGLSFAGDGHRTRTPLAQQGILSPWCLPIPPPRHCEIKF